MEPANADPDGASALIDLVSSNSTPPVQEAGEPDMEFSARDDWSRDESRSI